MGGSRVLPCVLYLILFGIIKVLAQKASASEILQRKSSCSKHDICYRPPQNQRKETRDVCLATKACGNLRIDCYDEEANDYDRFCRNDLGSFIDAVSSLINKHGALFDFAEYLVLQGYIDEQELKGVVVAKLSKDTLRSKSPYEINFYEHEPLKRLWIFSANILSKKRTTLDCLGVRKNADFRGCFTPCQAPQTRCPTCPVSTAAAPIPCRTNNTKPPTPCPINATSSPYTSTVTTTEHDGVFHASKKGDHEERCSGCAIAAVLSFIAGVILTGLAALFLLRYISTQKSCFGKNDDASTRRTTGACQSVTEQLDHGIGMGHAFDTAHNTYEAMEGANMHAAAENPYQTLDYIKPVQYSAENEHVYTGIGGQTGSDKINDKPQKPNASQTGQISGTENTYFVLEKEDRGDDGAQMPLQASGTDNTYFVLEKEDSGEAGAQVPPQAVGTENTYFVLEKEAQIPPLASGTENTYFVLEKEGSSDAQIPPKANGTDNTQFVLEKGSRLSSKIDVTDNTKTGH